MEDPCRKAPELISLVYPIVALPKRHLPRLGCGGEGYQRASVDLDLSAAGARQRAFRRLGITAPAPTPGSRGARRACLVRPQEGAVRGRLGLTCAPHVRGIGQGAAIAAVV